MTWQPLDRTDLARAPGGLGFVQDLLNTAYVGLAQPVDPLSDIRDARSWLAEALRIRSIGLGSVTPISIDPSDIDRIRELRGRLRSEVAGADTSTFSEWRGPAVTPVLRTDGTVTLVSEGHGYAQFAGLVAIDVFLAQQAGTWSRLKICRSEKCAVAFYDRSRNSSAVWHDARVCGNAHNLRASRARRQGSAV